jgi:hypothetical protein
MLGGWDLVNMNEVAAVTIGTPALVFERNYGAAITAERGNSLQVSVSAGDSHDWTVAVHSVAGGGEVPASALGASGCLSNRLAKRFLRCQRGHR